jgi:hypothetical protein
MANKLHYDITAKDRTKRVFSALGSSLKKVGKAVFNMKTALVGLAGVAGLGLLVRASLKSIDNLGKLSRQIFISTEDLGAFRLASELGGTSLEAFAKGARTLAVGINDYLVKGTGVAKEAFEQLGITADDLKSTNGDLFSQFEMVADALSQLKDGTDKTAIAYKLFGGRNIELLTAIEGGAGGLRKIREEAERFGLTLSSEMVKRVEDANDSMARMKMRMKGLIDNITVGLAPAFQRITDGLGKMFDGYIKNQGGVQNFSEVIVTKLLQAISIMVKMLANAIFAIERFMNKIKDMIKWTGLFDNGINQLEHSMTQWENRIEGNNEQIEALKNNLKIMDDVTGETAKTIKKLEDENIKFTEQIEITKQKVYDLTRAFEVTNDTGEDTYSVFKKIIETLDKLIKDIATVEQVSNRAMIAMANNNDLVAESIHKQTQAEKDLLEQKKASSKGAIAVFQTELEERLEFNKQIKQNTFDTLQALSGINKNAFRAFKAMQIAEVTINAIKSASSAFAQFKFPMNYLMAGSHYAKGMALVAQIRSTSYSGKRMGGGVREGTPYMVGEAGRELFVPNQSGNIVANDQLGRNVNVNFHIETVDAGGFDQLLSQRRSLIVNMINSAVNEQGKQAII